MTNIKCTNKKAWRKFAGANYAVKKTKNKG